MIAHAIIVGLESGNEYEERLSRTRDKKRDGNQAVPVMGCTLSFLFKKIRTLVDI